MTNSILDTLPARQGHFLLESGYHTDLWLSLDTLFVSPRQVAPLVAALANRLRVHGAGAVCGPLLGGAFLAHAIATVLDVDFYFAEPVAGGASAGLFETQYCLPAELRQRLDGERVVVVDDVISAGSSVRAAVAAVNGAGATTVAIGTILLLGTVARDHFANLGLPLEALTQREFALWQPTTCPLCLADAPLEDPRRTGTADESQEASS